MTFEAVDAGTTLVKIAESGWRETPKGQESSYGNYGVDADALLHEGLGRAPINLRQGFF